VFAHQAGLAGKKCLVVEKRPHVGGNLRCEKMEGINVHVHGPHIFHTSNQRVWEYVNSLAGFNRFTYSPLADYNGELFNLPFNMNTFYRLWGTRTPAATRERLEREAADYAAVGPENLEEQALKLAGRDIYTKLIKGYTEKQWGRPATELLPFIIKRIPLRLTFDNNYFNDAFQGIPIGGYNGLFEKMLAGADVRAGTDFFDNKDGFLSRGRQLIYTGRLDEFFGHCFGRLEYRSLRFETETLDIPDFQGCAAVNYTDGATPFTRIIEHKHFEFGTQPRTVITREYPLAGASGREPYYPVNDARNDALAARYKAAAARLPNVIFGGRLADYAYYDMDKVVARALDIWERQKQ
jgi:UDP-galactopyranose mutase